MDKENKKRSAMEGSSGVSQLRDRRRRRKDSGDSATASASLLVPVSGMPVSAEVVAADIKSETLDNQRNLANAQDLNCSWKSSSRRKRTKDCSDSATASASLLTLVSGMPVSAEVVAADIKSETLDNQRNLAGAQDLNCSWKSSSRRKRTKDCSDSATASASLLTLDVSGMPVSAEVVAADLKPEKLDNKGKLAGAQDMTDSWKSSSRRKRTTDGSDSTTASASLLAPVPAPLLQPLLLNIIPGLEDGCLIFSRHSLLCPRDRMALESAITNNQVMRGPPVSTQVEVATFSRWNAPCYNEVRMATAVLQEPGQNQSSYQTTPASNKEDKRGLNWSDLPEEILGLVATCGHLSVREVGNMRETCIAWKSAIPVMGRPWLVLSRCVAQSGDNFSFWTISPNVAELQPIQAWAPAFPTTCWGSSTGALALRRANSGSDLYLYRPLGGYIQILESLPIGTTPEALFTSPMQLWGIIKCAIFSPDSKVYIEEGGHGWHKQDRFGAHIRSVEFSDPLGIINVADNTNVVRIDVMGDVVNEARLHLPDIMPWLENGHHVFNLNGSVHLCIIGKSTTSGQVMARIFALAEGFVLEPTSSIGHHCLFLGPNRAIVCSSEDGPVGRRAETIYIEDRCEVHRNARILMINVVTQQVVTISFPPEVAVNIRCYGPSRWLNAWEMP
ncbi:hypothetical protein ACP4OV_026131 [Aristida adscensionis]